MTLFVSVDVETTSSELSDGHLLTVGAVAVHYSPGRPQGAMIGRSDFYVRLDIGADATVDWSAAPAGTPAAETRKWWLDQEPRVQEEAWLDRTLVRHEPRQAALMFAEWVREANGSAGADVEGGEAGPVTFVANPVSFDKPFVDRWFHDTGVPNPFHYRSLCLRSMAYGLQPQQPFGSDRTTMASPVPHHALHDAYAQAHDLCRLLALRDRYRFHSAPSESKEPS